MPVLSFLDFSLVLFKICRWYVFTPGCWCSSDVSHDRLIVSNALRNTDEHNLVSVLSTASVFQLIDCNRKYNGAILLNVQHQCHYDHAIPRPHKSRAGLRCASAWTKRMRHETKLSSDETETWNRVTVNSWSRSTLAWCCLALLFIVTANLLHLFLSSNLCL